ncbi:ester cyclase [Halosimplex litoreum]|uniref:Ester cyclase n=1 Tax=Halosimplex litoreum TaxID=1198301 RepID=A0A7T3G125_9EURY|nr:ester cyclase [Halosimplex litoreum]QPV64368.1 ester cyclase [Halosimplex litoreum]
MTEEETDGPSVAIACQGGGSHTAFTAGVLDRLLGETDLPFDVAGLSGTSGGAICAFATWFGLASEGEGTDGRARARQLLADIWDDIAAEGPSDAVANSLGVATVRAQNAGVPLPTLSPYDTPLSDLSRETLRRTLETAVDPEALAATVDRTDRVPPRLEIGAVDVQRGTFRTFTERDVSHDAVLASAAVPTLFRAAPVTGPYGRNRWYWDGLFSQNPPLADLFEPAPGRRGHPDEIWVVQINPQREASIPKSLDGIADRRNELGGNLSVNQELAHVRRLNHWSAVGSLGDVYSPVEVKTIELDESAVSPGRPFDYASKVDRSPRFLDRLWEHGRDRADRFLATERGRRRARATATAAWNRDDGGEPASDDEDGLSPDAAVTLPTSLVELRAALRGESERTETVFDREGYRQFVAAMREAIPDLRVDVEEAVTEPGSVALRWHGEGTHSGSLAGIEPTGRDVALSGTSIHHLDDGRITESWVLTEHWSLLRQIDAIDPPAALSTTDRVTATPVVTQLSAPAENRDLVRLLAEVWTDGRREALDRVLAPDCVVHLDDETDLHGPEAYWAFVDRYREAFPDLSVTVEDTVSEGDKVVLRTTLRGTHDGPFLGLEPTGESVAVSRMAIYHVEDGYVVEIGMVEDTVRLLHQLGAPPLGQPVDEND